MPGFAVSISRSVWQAEEAVANLPLRLAVRVHCGHQVWRGSRGVLNRLFTGTHGVLYGVHRGAYGTVRSEECAAAVCRARLSSFSRRLERVCEWPNDRMCWLQGLELLVTVLLARNRQPPPAVAAGVPHAELAAELVSLPSGLLAMVCEAIGKLKVRLWAA